MMRSVASTYSEERPAEVIAADNKRTLILSPSEATASSARGVASPSTAMAWHNVVKVEIKAPISDLTRARLAGSVIDSSAMLKCAACNFFSAIDKS